MSKRWFLAGVFLTCLVTLMLQVIETRLRSVSAALCYLALIPTAHALSARPRALATT